MKIGKIETAADAAAAVKRLTPANRKLLIRALAAQHPNLASKTDSEISRMLTQFVKRNS